MKIIDAIQVIKKFDEQGRFVFTKQDLVKLFPKDRLKTFEESLKRLLKAGVLVRACRGIYVNEQAQSKDAYLIEHVAKALRRGEYNYVSLESILSEYGVISQIPVSHLTIMTTGRRGTYKTPYGVIEFTHTKRPVVELLKSMRIVEKRPLRVATKAAAVRDLNRVGRNKHLLQQDEEND